MFMLVVLSALLAVAAAKPSHLAAYVAPSVYGVPGVSAYSAPLVSSYGHTTYAHSPLVSAYAAAPYVSPYGVAPVSPLALHPASPANVINAAGHPFDTVDVVNARAAHYTAKVLNAHGIHKRSVPLAYSGAVYAAPAAVSHQSRIDIPTSRAVVAAPVFSTYGAAPVVSAYTSPVVSAYSSPLVSAYSSPVVSAYSSPLVSAYSSPVVAHGAYGSPVVSHTVW